MKNKLTSLLLGLVTCSGLTAQGVPFTYQGRLDRDGQTATGNHEMIFTLYESPNGGTAISTNRIIAKVENGVFTVPVDFGDALFSGKPAWIGIEVAPLGSREFSTLAPRTRLDPAPKAFFAQVAGSVTNGAIKAPQLAATGSPGPGKVLGYDGNSLAWQPAGSDASVWTLNGNNVSYNVGRVGIGTSSPAGKLHVAQGGLAVSGASSPYVGAGAGVFMESYPSFGVLFAYDYNVNRPMSLALNSPGGNVGIGTATPSARLEIVGQDALRMTGFQPFLTLADGNAGNARSVIQGAGGGIFFKTEGYLSGSSAAGLAILNNEGNFSVASLTIRGGADLAEPFPMKENSVEEGSVVVIDDEHPGRLKLSTRAYDTQVAGIISGANGIHPGIALKQEGVLDQGQNVALTGRVYVKADANHGAIRPGDLLTTSAIPGHAMKVTEHAKSQGAILGKAMSTLKDGTGFVLVLVTLQ